MNQEKLLGNWQKLKGTVKKQWGKLTDDDLKELEGDYDELVGKLTERYGFTKEKAQQKIEKFLNNIDDHGNYHQSIINDVSEAAEEAGDKVYDAAKAFQKFSKNKPFTTMGVVAVAGILVGMLISRS
jgi:uncharacterized protein YjbJ (UPF0337 family)